MSNDGVAAFAQLDSLARRILADNLPSEDVRLEHGPDLDPGVGLLKS